MRWYDSLRRRNDFAFVRRRGRAASLPTLTAFAADGRDPRPQVGISVSKAVGTAVVRNLVRRRIQGALDALDGARPARVRLVLIARPPAASAGFAVLAADVRAAVARVAGP